MSRKPREPKAKPEYNRAINDSGLTVVRTMSAIQENYQQAYSTADILQEPLPSLDG